MTINEIAARLAANHKTTPEMARKLLEAEARLIRETMPSLSRIETSDLMTRRYTQSPEVSQMAAINPTILANAAISNKMTPSAAQAAATAYLAVLEDYLEASTGDAGLPDNQYEIMGFEWTKWVIPPEELAKAAAKTEGLRRARGDVQYQFDLLSEGKITVEEYSEYIDMIQYQLDEHEYDDGYLELMNELEPYLEVEDNPTDEELTAVLGVKFPNR